MLACPTAMFLSREPDQIAGQALYELLDAVHRTGEPYSGRGVP